MNDAIKPPYVGIIHKKGQFIVNWRYSALRKKGSNLCYIPGFDMYFSATNDEMVRDKSKAVMRCFFDHIFIHNKKNSLKQLAIELKKKGFSAKEMDAMVMKKFLKNIPTNANFSSNAQKPFDFNGAVEVNQDAEMEIAC